MSMVFCASARTTTFTLFLLAVLLIEDRDFCTTSFPRYPPKLDFDDIDIVVVVNELAAANIVVVVVVLSVVVYVVSLCVCVYVCVLSDEKRAQCGLLNLTRVWNHKTSNIDLGFFTFK